MVHKFALIVAACCILSACGTLGWMAGKTVLPAHKPLLQVKTTVADKSYGKNNQGNLDSHNFTAIKSPNKVIITTVPWPLIWILMIGWPLALIGWMIDPPCEIYRRYRHRKAHQKKFHVEHA